MTQVIDVGTCKRCGAGGPGSPAALVDEVCIGGCMSIEIDGGSQSERRVVMEKDAQLVSLFDNAQGTFQKRMPHGIEERLSRPWDLHYMVAKRQAQGWTLVAAEPQSWDVLVIDQFDPNFPGSVIESHKVKGELDGATKQILDGWMEAGDRLVKDTETLEDGTTQICYFITTQGGDSDIMAVCRRVATK